MQKPLSFRCGTLKNTENTEFEAWKHKWRRSSTRAGPALALFWAQENLYKLDQNSTKESKDSYTEQSLLVIHFYSENPINFSKSSPQFKHFSLHHLQTLPQSSQPNPWSFFHPQALSSLAKGKRKTSPWAKPCFSTEGGLLRLPQSLTYTGTKPQTSFTFKNYQKS